MSKNIFKLIEDDDVEGVKEYIAKGGDVNAIQLDPERKLTLLHKVMCQLSVVFNKDGIKIAQLLIDAGAELDYNYNDIDEIITMNYSCGDLRDKTKRDNFLTLERRERANDFLRIFIETGAIIINKEKKW